MENLLIVSLVAAPPLLIALLHRTRLWWVAGAGLLAGAFYMFSLVAPVDSDESDAGLGGIANFVLVAGGVLIAIYGVSALAFAARLHNRYRERVEQLPPAATVVAGVTRR
jgi:hypothetical protein